MTTDVPNHSDKSPPQSGDKSPHSTHWPHAPTHRLATSGTYFVTAGTYLKQHHFRDPTRLDVLQRGLLALASEFQWRLEAWCILSNHYHFVAHSPNTGAETLPALQHRLHGKLSRWVNRLDNTPGRQVWFNYWDTRLTHEKSYLARLHYTHANAVHHKVAEVSKPISLVFRRVVRAHGHPRAGEDHLRNANRHLACGGQFLIMECGDSSPLCGGGLPPYHHDNRHFQPRR